MPMPTPTTSLVKRFRGSACKISWWIRSGLRRRLWLALFGGVLGTFAFVLSVLNYRRDRPKLHFSAYDDSNDQRILRRTIYLCVTNVGRRTLQMGSPWIYWRDGHNWPMRETDSVRLGEQDHVIFELTKDRLIDDVLAFSVRDAAGRFYWHYPRFRPFEGMRLRIQQWRRQIP